MKDLRGPLGDFYFQKWAPRLDGNTIFEFPSDKMVSHWFGKGGCKVPRISKGVAWASHTSRGRAAQLAPDIAGLLRAERLEGSTVSRCRPIHRTDATMAILVGDVPAVLWGGELEHWCLCPRPLPRTNRVPRGPSNNQFLRKIPDPEIYIYTS